MKLNRRSIRDDRGQRVYVRVPGMTDSFRFSREERDVVWTYERIVDARSAAHPLQVCSVMLVELVIAVLLAVTTHRQWSAGMYSDRLATGLFVVAGGVVVVSLFQPFLTIARLRKLERARHNLPYLCPQCLYSFAGLSRESDGCIVCPECGAAWRFNSD